MQTQQETQAAKRKTRAQILRDRVVIRLAIDEAGPKIGALFVENGIEIPGADWSKVFPHWLIACDGDKVIGCLQVMPAKPVAWIQCLQVKPTIQFKLRAIAIRKLIAAGMSTCHAAGSAVIMATIDARDLKFEGVLTNLNFVHLVDTRLLAKQLA